MDAHRSPELLRLLETAVDQLRDIVFITTAERTERAGGREIVFVNRAFTEISGYSPAEAIGSTPNLTVGPETDRQVLGRIEEGLRARRPVHEELLKYGRDGKSYWVDLDIIPVFDDAGAHTHWVSVQRDITERKLLHEKLVETERIASVGTLAASIAHEMNNPLAYVAANLEYLTQHLAAALSSGPDAAERREIEQSFKDTSAGVGRVRAIIGKMNLLARNDEGPREPVTVCKVLTESVDIAHNQIRHRARLVEDYGALPPVDGVEGRLVQVFVNLLVNAAHAVKHRPAEDNVVTVRARHVGDRVVVTIEDNGSGIDPKVREKLFRPFVTTKPKGEGTGLGLYVCQEIVQGLGGSIDVASELGTGTTFTVSLPVAEVAVPRVAPAPMSAAPPVEDPERRARLLIVDDEPLVASGLRRLLRTHYDIETALGGTEALVRLKAQDYDAVLCDVMMPDLSGVDVHRALRELRGGSERRIVFMTGGAFGPETTAELGSLRNARLTKPFDAALVRAAISAVLAELGPAATG